jgi:protein SCO1/2
MQRRAALAALLSLGAILRTARAAQADNAYELDFGFLDESRRTRHLAEWQGQPVVMTMAYGACRRVCSSTVRQLERLQTMAQQRGQPLQLLVVSLDPAQDRPEDWAALQREHKLDAACWHFLCGSAQATRAVANFLGLRYWSYDDHIVHDFRIARLDAQGRIVASLRWVDEDLSRLL